MGIYHSSMMIPTFIMSFFRPTGRLNPSLTDSMDDFRAMDYCCCCSRVMFSVLYSCSCMSVSSCNCILSRTVYHSSLFLMSNPILCFCFCFYSLSFLFGSRVFAMQVYSQVSPDQGDGHAHAHTHTLNCFNDTI